MSLELGGKSPNIVFEDAADAAIEGSANAIFFNHWPGRAKSSVTQPWSAGYVRSSMPAPS